MCEFFTSLNAWSPTTLRQRRTPRPGFVCRVIPTRVDMLLSRSKSVAARGFPVYGWGTDRETVFTILIRLEIYVCVSTFVQQNNLQAVNDSCDDEAVTLTRHRAPPQLQPRLLRTIPIILIE